MPMRFLIAEDDGISRLLLKRILQRGFACEVAEAVDGQAAWSHLQHGPLPELLFLDIMMPRKGGLQLLKEMREDERFRSVKVIMCTALSDRLTVRQAAALGISGYVLKPFVPPKIIEQVRSVIWEKPASDFLESPETVQSRLGIDGETYAHLIDMLIRDVGEAVATVREGLSREDRRCVRLALSSVAGAARNVGALGLLELVSQMDAALAGPSQGAEDTFVERLEQEHVRLIKAASIGFGHAHAVDVGRSLALGQGASALPG